MLRRTNILAIVIVLAASSVIAQCQWDAPAVPSGAPAGADRSDALLLYTSNKSRLSDRGFQKITRFYGLKLASVDLTSVPLTDELLRDEAGEYYPTIGVDSKTLQTALDKAELQVLERAVNTSGVNLLISALQYEKSSAVHNLTNGEITGTTKPVDWHRDYVVSAELPEITRELSSVTIAYDAEQLDHALSIAPSAPHTRVLVHATDDQGNRYPIFARYRKRAGSVFVLSNYIDPSLRDNLLRWNYAAKRSKDGFTQQWFAQILPMMMFVRFSAGAEAWHREQDYANFTLDDPPLQRAKFDYAGILQEAIKHNFHFTLAMPPAAYTKSEQAIVDLFLGYPSRLSLVQHGNNHDGYEFYKYAVDASDKYRARSLDEQEADIVEGRTRMEAHAHRTGIPYAPVMIFPHNTPPIETLVLLKQYNYQATINSMDYPLGVKRSESWSSYMYPAELDYNNFALIGRSAPGKDPYPFMLFIDQPIFVYAHRDLFEKSGIGAFNPLADQINGLAGDVEWRSIDYIMKHLYLEKRSDDGSIDVMFFGNHLVVDNQTGKAQTYHVTRRELSNIPIHRVTVDDEPTGYALISDTLQIDLTIPPQSSREVRIIYGQADKDFTVVGSDISIESQATGRLTASIRNQGTAAGPVSVEFFNGHPEEGAPSLGITTTLRIEPGHFAPVKLVSTTLELDTVCVVVDPYDIVLESEEANNMACNR